MEPRHVWVLNLDAEEELARPAGYAPTRAMERIVQRRSRTARALFAPGDRELGELDLGRGEPGELVGRAWCPTPWALARFQAAGVRAEPAPGLEALQRANSREFAFGLGSSLPGARLARSSDDVEAALRDDSGPWFAKRALSAAGRGKRKLAERLDDGDRAWVEASLATGTLLIEPFVQIELELGLHGRWSAGGELSRGRLCVQRCDERGAWRETRVARGDELSAAERRALDDAFERAAAGLRSIGYFGPFGLDAYRARWRGSACFQALSEINARHSMGYAVGFGKLDLLRA